MSTRAARRRRERELDALMKQRGLTLQFNVLRLDDPASEQRAAAIVADLDRTLADPCLHPRVRAQLERERRQAVVVQLLCASLDPTKPEPEACH